MTVRFICKTRGLWPVVVAFAWLVGSAAAQARERPTPNVDALGGPAPHAAEQARPAPEPHADDQELPVPYEAWQGAAPQPPIARAANDLPPPLARPRELPRRPFEVTLALAAFLPSCGSGSIDDRACLTVGTGSGIDAAIVYRVGPLFAFGIEGAASGFATRGQGALSRTGGAARFFGVVGRVYFADQGAWDPYLALTLGTGNIQLAGPGSERIATSGLGGRVAGGVDFLLGSHFRLGPSASFARWLAWSESSCSANVCRDQPAAYGRLLGFATLGAQLTGSFGDVL